MLQKCPFLLLYGIIMCFLCINIHTTANKYFHWLIKPRDLEIISGLSMIYGAMLHHYIK